MSVHLTAAQRQWVRTNPEKLSEMEMARRLGVTRDLVHGIRKKRKRIEVDIRFKASELAFIRANTHRCSFTQMRRVILALTGVNLSTYWFARIHKLLCLRPARRGAVEPTERMIFRREGEAAPHESDSVSDDDQDSCE